MRSKTIPLVPVLALVVMAIPTAAWATHEVSDERPPTPLVDFREAMGSWLDPWLNETPSDIRDDHAPWLAFALYEELLGIKPESCYWDTYAAYWAVAAGLRALGQAPNRKQQEGEFERVFEDVARADALAELSALHCLTRGTDSSRVIEIEATGALQFTDGRGDLLHEIAVTAGETVVFRVHNSADFEHGFYIRSESQLHEPAGTTDTGIEMWAEGVSESEWRVPADGATPQPRVVPGQYSPKTVVVPSSMARTSKGASFSPGMPGEPDGIPGSAMPSMSGRSVNRSSMASAGTWPSTV